MIFRIHIGERADSLGILTNPGANFVFRFRCPHRRHPKRRLVLSPKNVQQDIAALPVFKNFRQAINGMNHFSVRFQNIITPPQDIFRRTRPPPFHIRHFAGVKNEYPFCFYINPHRHPQRHHLSLSRNSGVHRHRQRQM